MWNINVPQRRIPCAIFTKFAEFVSRFRMRYLLKFRWICSRDCGVMEVLSWRGLVIPKFSKSHSGETMCQTWKVLEVQERAWGPLSPCQVWWGSDFTRRRGGQKRRVFNRQHSAHCSAKRRLLWPPCVADTDIIFLPCGFFLYIFLFYLFPRLISAVADWMSTILPHMMWP